MVLQAASEHGIDLTRSVAIGDKPRDVEAGLRAGCAAGYLLVEPGADGGEPSREPDDRRVVRVARLDEAVRALLSSDPP